MIVTPYDGSVLADLALRRAIALGDRLERPVLAVTVVPHENEAYARQKGWVDEDEPFRSATIKARLRERIEEVDPDVDFEYVPIGRHSPAGQIANRIRQFGRSNDASIVVVGSENAGHVVSGLASIGAKVAAEDAYDVYIVRPESVPI
ncbi:MAG: universal stress protein [Halobacteriota archaeon]